MINNFLAGGNQEFIVGDPSTNVFFFRGQKQISETLIVIVFICVPIMLCTKPCVMMWCKKPHEEGHGHAGEFQPLNNAEEGGLQQQRASVVGAQADIKAYSDLLNQENEGKGGHDAHNVNEAFIH